MLLLKRASNTIVGDEMQRGVSGGEKKRVTSGEMLVSVLGLLLSVSVCGQFRCLSGCHVSFAAVNLIGSSCLNLL